MRSVFTLALDIIALHEEMPKNHNALQKFIENKPICDASYILSDRFLRARDEEDRMCSTLSRERGENIFRETLGPYLHPYELPQEAGLEREVEIATAQMTWGAHALVTSVAVQQNFSEMRRALDRLQALCSVTQILPFRVANTYTPYNLKEFIKKSESPQIVDTINDILSPAYGCGSDALLGLRGGYPVVIDAENMVYNIMRIEKNDRLRHNRPLILAH